MKRASYRSAVDWIADMDEGAERDPCVMSDVPTVVLTAYIFGVDPARVAQDVVRLRARADAQREASRG